MGAAALVAAAVGAGLDAPGAQIGGGLGGDRARVLQARLQRGAVADVAVDVAAGDVVADDATLDALEGEGRVVFRYLEHNPNGSFRDIAGITNAAGTVVGLMPHPEHAVESLFGPDPRTGTDGTDGLRFFTSALKAVLAA